MVVDVSVVKIPPKKAPNFNADVVWAGNARNAKAQRFLNDAATFLKTETFD